MRNAWGNVLQVQYRVTTRRRALLRHPAIAGRALALAWPGRAGPTSASAQ